MLMVPLLAELLRREMSRKRVVVLLCVDVRACVHTHTHTQYSTPRLLLGAMLALMLA